MKMFRRLLERSGHMVKACSKMERAAFSMSNKVGREYSKDARLSKTRDSSGEAMYLGKCMI
jgi:hypothetical protein